MLQCRYYGTLLKTNLFLLDLLVPGNLILKKTDLLTLCIVTDCVFRYYQLVAEELLAVSSSMIRIRSLSTRMVAHSLSLPQ